MSSEGGGVEGRKSFKQREGPSAAMRKLLSHHPSPISTQTSTADRLCGRWPKPAIRLDPRVPGIYFYETLAVSRNKEFQSRSQIYFYIKKESKQTILHKCWSLCRLPFSPSQLLREHSLSTRVLIVIARMCFLRCFLSFKLIIPLANERLSLVTVTTINVLSS